MLYLDVLLGRTISDIEDLYSDSTWVDAKAAVSSTQPDEYAESVVMSWMAQREDMGETLDPNKDARILPTMESHQTTAMSCTERCKRIIAGIVLMVGRDWTEASAWGQGQWNLQKL